eukprot:COSAG01_NODE_18118_length_1099_cov_2.755000_1_plen_197_part_10
MGGAAGGLSTDCVWWQRQFQRAWSNGERGSGIGPTHEELAYFLREGAWRTLTPEEEEAAEETDRPSWVNILKTYQDAGQSLAQMEEMLREGFLRTYRGVGNLLNRDELVDDAQVTADDAMRSPSPRHVLSTGVRRWRAHGVVADTTPPLGPGCVLDSRAVPTHPREGRARCSRRGAAAGPAGGAQAGAQTDAQAGAP